METNYILIPYIIFINIVGFAAMETDKMLARKHMWRISEAKLLFIAFIGGAFGSLIGMYFFHHKTLHWKFVIGIPVLLGFNLGVLAYLLF